MINYKVLQLLFLVSSMASQVIGMLPPEEVRSMPFQVEGIAQKIAELPKELQYDIFSSALALRETQKYGIYKKFNIDSPVFGIALNEGNTRAFTGSWDGVARLWDVEKRTVIKELEDHREPIMSVALSADGTLALTGSMDGTARVWDTLIGEPITTLEVGSSVGSVALSADGKIALTGSQDGIVRLYNTSTGELLKELKGHEGQISSVALSSDGTLALTGSIDGTARIWDTLTGKPIATLQGGSPVGLEALSSDGTEVGSDVLAVALSSDGTLALTGTIDKVLVWDVKTGSLLNTLLIKDDIYSVAVSKDGKRALVGTGIGNIEVWNTQPLPGKIKTSTPLTVLEGHTEPVTAVAFGSDDFIASGSYGGTALIWSPFTLEPRGPQEHEEILRQAYKETFSRPLLRSTNGN